MQQDERSRMLGTMPMNRLIPKVSVPIMVSMVVQAAYNVVDSIFISRVNPLGLTAVSLAYPFQMLMIALSVGMGTGIMSLLSRKLGEHRPDEARRAAWNGFLIEAAGWLLFAAVGLFLAPTLLGLVVNADTLQNAGAIRDMGVTYLSIVTTWSFGLFMAVLMERLLQSTGNTVLSMVTQLSGALTNIILDPILIFGANMGVTGAAVATVIGQWVSAAVGFILNQTKNRELRLNLKDFRVDPAILRGILAVGAPSTVMQAIGSAMNVGMNAILSGFAAVGNAAVNVLNVYFKLQSFIFMPCFGLGAGMIAIVGYNYGARLRQRVYEAVRTALRYAMIIMAVGMLIFQVFPEFLMSVFDGSDAIPEAAAEAGIPDDETLLAMDEGEVPKEWLEAREAAQKRLVAAQMRELGPAALRTISLCFILAAVGITLSNVFQAVGRGMYSMVLSICRQLAVLLPSALLLKAVFGTVGAVWWSFLIAEGVSCVICLAMYRHLKVHVLENL
ncbi:MAG: MATE family efflux transporter [Clostridia bacterium]|nr:MATE family efflux transporter [Clostridia bacterium]